MIVENKFCCICNSRDFEDYNNRKSVKCRFCNAVERHRSFALALFSLPSIASISLCVVQAGMKKPKYLEYLSGYVEMDFVSWKQLEQGGRTYDVVYHDHLLGNSFMAVEDYSQLIPKVAEILVPGGIQLFSVGKRLLLGNLLDRPAQVVDGFVPVAPDDRGTGRGGLMAFDPVPRYGKGIGDTCVLGKSAPATNSSDVIFASRKYS